MNRREKHLFLRNLTCGSFDGERFHMNQLRVSEDLKELVVFHTCDKDFTGAVPKTLRVTCTPQEAIQLWRLPNNTKHHVNIFSLNLDEIPFNYLNWRDGDSYECSHGGIGFIEDTSLLAHIAYVWKADLIQTLNEMRFVRLLDLDAEKLADSLLFNNDYEDYNGKPDPDIFSGLFVPLNVLYFGFKAPAIRSAESEILIAPWDVNQFNW